MSKNQKIIAVSLLAVALIALTPLFAMKGAEFGGSDDAGSQMVESIRGESYEPWFTPALEQLLGGELPGEVESLFFCVQTGLGVGVLAFGFGYLVARKKYNTKEPETEKEGNSMLLGALTGLVLYCLLVGALPKVALLLLCVLTGAVLLAFGHHSHGDVLVIDIWVRRSRYFAWSPGLKTAGCFLLLCLCVSSPSPWIPLVLAGILMCLSVWGGGIALHDYLRLLSLPALFLLLSGLALLWDYGTAEGGVLSLPIGRGWLVVTAAAQIRARLVMARAFGAVSCLYFLSLSTTVPEVLSVLGRAHMPPVMRELAVLIYRYIFLLLSTYQSMRDAAASRLGYDGFRRSLRTAGAVYGNLLAASFRRAGACFDAMESRCYDGEIRFLEREKPLTVPAVLLFAGLLGASGTAWVLMRNGR